MTPEEAKDFQQWLRAWAQAIDHKLRTARWHLILKTRDGAMRTMPWEGAPPPVISMPLYPRLPDVYSQDLPIQTVIETRNYEREEIDFPTRQAYYREM